MLLGMNRQDRERAAAMRQIEQGQISQAEAAAQLGLSTRQLRRVVKRWRERGDEGLIHKARGRASNRRRPQNVRENAVAVIREQYADFGPTLASETLAERHNLMVDRETLRRWMRHAGLNAYTRRPQPRRRQRPRRARRGELVQMDTSIHNWLEGRGPQIVLIVLIDDATSAIWADFFPADTTLANMALLRDYIAAVGRPEALYTDRASHFWIDAPPDARQSHLGQRPLTQIGRALDQLAIRLITARSPQAKGRVERSFQTMQDRLVKSMRLANVRTLAHARQHLRDCFVPFWNQRFAILPQENAPAFQPADQYDLDAILSIHETRTLQHDFTIQHGARILQINTKTAPKEIRPGAKILVQLRIDGSTKLQASNQYLDFTTIGKSQNRRKMRNARLGGYPPNPSP